MTTSVQKWGNSLAVRIPRSLASELGLTEGTSVELGAEDDRLIVRPAAPSYRLDDLVKKITPKNRHGETSTGDAVGAEAW